MHKRRFVSALPQGYFYCIVTYRAEESVTKYLFLVFRLNTAKMFLIVASNSREKHCAISRNSAVKTFVHLIYLFFS